MRRIFFVFLLFAYGMGPQGFSLWGHGALHERGSCRQSGGSCGASNVARSLGASPGALRGGTPGAANLIGLGATTHAAPLTDPAGTTDAAHLADPPGSAPANSQLPNEGWDHAPCWICQALATGTLNLAGDAPAAQHISITNIAVLAQPAVLLTCLDFDSHSPRGPPLS